MDNGEQPAPEILLEFRKHLHSPIHGFPLLASLDFFLQSLDDVPQWVTPLSCNEYSTHGLSFLIDMMNCPAERRRFGDTQKISGGQRDPQLNCGASGSHSPACGLGDRADTGPTMDELDRNVEQISTWWLPVMCSRVEVALKAKFQSPSI